MELTLDLVLFDFMLQEFRIYYLSVSVNPGHFLQFSYFHTASKDIFFQSAYPISAALCREYLHLHALILLALWHYISHVLTYLVTH